MDARRYGISLPLVRCTHSWAIELKTRRIFPYLQATMYYSVYHIDTIALYWQEKPTLLMNENKRIDNPRIKIANALALRLKMEKCVSLLSSLFNGLCFLFGLLENSRRISSALSLSLVIFVLTLHVYANYVQTYITYLAYSCSKHKTLGIIHRYQGRFVSGARLVSMQFS